ncbi:205_t:CDS:1, partial [Gigaspora rosea]
PAISDKYGNRYLPEPRVYAIETLCSKDGKIILCDKENILNHYIVTSKVYDNKVEYELNLVFNRSVVEYFTDSDNIRVESKVVPVYRINF